MENYDTYEYVIVPRSNARRVIKKTLLITLYIVFVIAWLIFGVMSGFATLLALIPITLWILIFYTWRYVNIEYEYSVSSGVITFSKIYGGRSRKRMGELDIRDVSELWPLGNEKLRQRLDEFDPESETSFLSSDQSDSAYAAIYVDKDGTKSVLYLEVLPRLMKSFKIYNSAVVKNLALPDGVEK